MHSCLFVTAKCSVLRNTFIQSILTMSSDFVVKRDKKKYFALVLGLVFFVFSSRSVLTG